MRTIDTFLNQIRLWAAQEPEPTPVLLVGSYARGQARADSDVDLVIITATPQHYLEDESWLHAFGMVQSVQLEDWGMVQSQRVFYADMEVEFGITTPAWAHIDPVDAGTARVVRDGAQIIHDPAGMLARLLNTVNDQRTAT